jgi:HAD superfamily hydrolase (TIGR01509 family)
VPGARDEGEDSRPDDIAIVLFDLGGVLVDFGGVDAMKDLARVEDDELLWHRWLSCPWVRRFERGECSDADFATGMVDEWELDLTPEDFLDQFRSWLGGPLPGAEALVEEVRRTHPAGCLSNTNALHWDQNFSRWPILDAFDFRFLSFQLGVVKPDRDLFERVAQLLPVSAARVLFLDDNLVNVEGAQAVGFVAAHVRGVDEARRAVAAAGVIDA